MSLVFLGGVRSATSAASSFAATRERGRLNTSSVRVSAPSRTVTVSPVRTSRPGFASLPLTVTQPL